MPGTMRGLLHGIGEAMPQVAQLIMANYQFEEEKRLRERGLGIQEQQAGTQAKRAETERQEFKARERGLKAESEILETEADSAAELMGLKKKAMKLANRMNAQDIKIGGAELERIRKETERISASIRNMDAQTLSIERQATARILDTTAKYMNLAATVSLNPGDIQGIFEKDTVDGMINELAKAGAKFSPATKAAAQGTLRAIQETQQMYQQLRMGYIESYYQAHDDATPEEADAYADQRMEPFVTYYKSFFGADGSMFREPDPGPPPQGGGGFDIGGALGGAKSFLESNIQGSIGNIGRSVAIGAAGYFGSIYGGNDEEQESAPETTLTPYD